MADDINIAAPEPLVAEALSQREELCSDCPPLGYVTDKTRCTPCPRRKPGALLNAKDRRFMTTSPVAPDLLMERGAKISECGRYRYVLWRRWDKDRPRLIFIMLNPSTADAAQDDATIRVCMGRAHRGGYGGIRVLNLFAYRATNPHELAKVDDLIGLANDYYLEHYGALEHWGERMIAAWGDGGLARGLHRERWREALSILCYDRGHLLYHLGLTKAGQPKHPLRIAYSVEPILWMNRDLYLRGIDA